MSTLSSASAFTSADIAAWVQAVGSILAIIAAAGIASWQGKNQYQNALALQREDQRHSRIQLAKSLLVLAQNSTNAVANLTKQLKDRQIFEAITEGRVHFDSGDLIRLDGAIAGIPLYNLPDSLVTPTMLLSSTIRQFREKTEMAIRVHRKMDAADFAVLFNTFDEMNQSLKQTCEEIANELDRIRYD